MQADGIINTPSTYNPYELVGRIELPKAEKKKKSIGLFFFLFQKINQETNVLLDVCIWGMSIDKVCLEPNFSFVTLVVDDAFSWELHLKSNLVILISDFVLMLLAQPGGDGVRVTLFNLYDCNCKYDLILDEIFLLASICQKHCLNFFIVTIYAFELFEIQFLPLYQFLKV